MEQIVGYSSSPQQRRLWSQATRPERACALRIWEVRGALDPERLKAAWADVLAAHESLRTRLQVPPGQKRPVQVILERAEYRWHAWHLGGEHEHPEVYLTERLMAVEETEPVQLVLATLSETRHLVAVRVAATYCDRQSLDVLGRDWTRCYTTSLSGAAERPEPVQFSQYAEWLQQVAEQDQDGARFWAESTVVGDAAAVEGALDACRPASLAPVFLDAAACDEAVARMGRSFRGFWCASLALLAGRLAQGERTGLAVHLDGRSFPELEATVGPFERFVPLMLDGEGDLSFADWVEHTDGRLEAIQDWQDYFDLTADRPSRLPEWSILFEATPESLPAGEATVKALRTLRTSEAAPIGLTVGRDRDRIRLTLDYDAARVTESEADTLLRRLLVVVEAASGTEAPSRAIGCLPILTPGEADRVLGEFNRTSRPDRFPNTFDRLFGERISAYGARVALTDGTRQSTYAELEARANRIAHELIAAGIEPDQVVGVCYREPFDAIPAMLGVMKSGAAYCFLDAKLPLERLRYMVEVSGARRVLTESEQEPLWRETNVPTWVTDRDWDRAARHAGEAPAPRSSDATLAYVVFTSGSTGRPKGVMVAHRNLRNYLNGLLHAIPELAESGTFALVSSLSADLGLTMLYPSLLLGGTLHLLSQDKLFNALSFGDYCADHGIEALKITPSHLNALMDRPQPEASLPRKVLIVGGEATGWEMAERLHRLAPAMKIYNHYGPSETCVGVLTHAYGERVASTGLPIGKPISNTHAYIVTPQGAAQPIGVAGELLIGGPSVSRGYIGREEETRRRFIANPFAGQAESAPRLYRTGDAARFLEDGSIEFLGRVDRQVKIRGFRVELDEIEAVLNQIDAVREAVVDLHGADGERPLVAWLVAEPAEEAAIRAALARSLPDYMVPTHFQFLAALPLTANGKVDRVALRTRPLEGTRAAADYVAPRSPLERVLAVIWQDVLGVERVGVEEEFFFLGGHSLLLIVVNTRIKNLFRVELTTAELFQATTLAEMATLLERHDPRPDGLDGVARRLLEMLALTPEQRATLREEAQTALDGSSEIPTAAEPGEKPIPNRFDDEVLVRHFLGEDFGIAESDRGLTPRPDPSQRPLSFEQQRLWFLDQMERGSSSAYNNTLAFRIAGPLNVTALSRAIAALEERHETLRTTFRLEQGEPVTVLQPPRRDVLPRVDLSGLDPERREAEVRRLIGQAATTPFDLEQGPIWRTQLLDLAEDQAVWIVVMHHICSDGWSMRLLKKEIGQLYRAFDRDETPQLAPLPIQYVDYAWWQRDRIRAEVLATHLDFWRERLAGHALVPQWPTDRPRPEVQTYNGASLRVAYDADLRHALLARAREERASLFMLMLSAFSALQGFFAGTRKVLTGTDVANRNHRETEPLFGFFVNQLALSTDLSGDPSLRQILQRCRDTSVAAFAHAELPFDQMVNGLNLARDLSHSPVFQTKVFLEHTPVDANAVEVFPGVTVTDALPENTGAARLDLTLGLWDLGDGGIEGWLSYNTDLFERATAEEIVALLPIVLDGFRTDPDLSLSDLEARLREHRNQRADQVREARTRNKMSKFKKGKRRKVVVDRAVAARFEPLAAGVSLPLVLQTDMADFDLVGWARANREVWNEALHKSGALLFRGHGIDRPEAMDQVSAVFIDELFTENTEHRPVTGAVQVPVDYAADQHLLWHSENSFNHEWPRKIMFACGRPAESGGQTPLVDNREVYKRLDPSVRRGFEEKGVLYMRNCNPHLGLDWRTLLRTEDRDEAIARCRAAHQRAEWRANDVLRTQAVRPAVIAHPVTGEKCWFNQAQHWHIACLDEATRASITEVYGEEDYPRHCYFGDGSPIEDAMMDHILAVYRELETSFPWQRGDLVLVDNVLAAHARRPYRGDRTIYVAMGDLRAYDVVPLPTP
ncbi:non-ribosomal peptide synthetase [Sulfidibacter corallicola]|uniref:Amino acid adenylation domain-containing protein n=1 Tax=Sulfidibacter corallicola TaxID=2818388 RepID=A0A8A4TP59_SULCO|nr:non-ribosomal peptide synthetase [Sulfidibacter corallicola]QTD48375.1 amino acid adenylation domain-containing protein [Sulfidibacter corallicola]